MLRRRYPKTRKSFVKLLGATSLLLFAICAMLPKRVRSDAHEYRRVQSKAIRQDVDTKLKTLLSPYVKKNTRKSGFHVVETADESMIVRIALLRAAQRSIDLQYYTVNDDVTSNLFLEAAVEAAGRGVRVRFLIDGVSLNEAGKSLALLDQNQNIEIRVFNPVATPGIKPLTWFLRITTDLGHSTRRMHNKAMIVDNQMAMVGGRNLGDEYFETAPDRNLRDIDMLAAGPAAADISASFDKYWNARNSFPISLLKKHQASQTELKELKERLHLEWQKHLRTAKGKRLEAAKMEPYWIKNLVWAAYEVVADDPDKINQPSGVDNSRPFARLLKLLNGARFEFFMTSPYFIPKRQGVAVLGELVQKNVTTKVLTNSLSSTDMVIAHSGYKGYRKKLLDSGVQLYEMKASEGKNSSSRSPLETPAKAMIHTKTYVIDRMHVMIGSFNFDPRSINQNTEIALIIHSNRIADKISEMFKDSIGPRNAYRLGLKKGSIEWADGSPGKEHRVYTSEPQADLSRRFGSALLGLLPIDDYI